MARKTEVERLNRFHPLFRFLAGGEGFGTVFDAIISAVNAAVDGNISGADATTITAAFLADKVAVANLRYYLLSQPLGAAGCAQGTTATKVKTTTTIPTKGNGQIYTLAATDDYWTLTGAALAASHYRGYLLLVDDDASTPSVVATADLTAPPTGADWWAAIGSQMLSGVVIVGFVVVATDGSHTFTPGTTHLDAAGITATFGDGSPQALMTHIPQADDGSGVTGVTPLAGLDRVPELV